MTKHQELPVEGVHSFLKLFHIAIRIGIKLLAFTMVIIIIVSIIDVVYEIILAITSSDKFIPRQSDILKLFGAVMTTLIGIEIFINVRMYLGSEEFPVKLVLATALMAIARKIIVLDFNLISGIHALSIGFITVSLGITYYLLSNKMKRSDP